MELSAEQIIKYIQNAVDNVYIDVEESPTTHDRKIAAAAYEAFKQVKLIQNSNQ